MRMRPSRASNNRQTSASALTLVPCAPCTPYTQQRTVKVPPACPNADDSATTATQNCHGVLQEKSPLSITPKSRGVTTRGVLLLWAVMKRATWVVPRSSQLARLTIKPSMPRVKFARTKDTIISETADSAQMRFLFELARWSALWSQDFQNAGLRTCLSGYP
jgi:hypothetical protein